MLAKDGHKIDTGPKYFPFHTQGSSKSDVGDDHDISHYVCNVSFVPHVTRLRLPNSA